MTQLQWDEVGKRLYETGVDHGVLYVLENSGQYGTGVAWNGLTTVTESPSGAEANPQYADNIKYLNLISAEEFGGTIEAFTYPVLFEQCDGTAAPTPGVTIGQQTRRTFGFAYRTLVGNDIVGTDYGYKIHLVYGAQAAPSEKSRATVNDSPEAVAFSWEFTTTPVQVPGFKPSSTITIDSTQVDAQALSQLETILYGSETTDPRLPLPAEVFALFAGTITEVTPTKPTQAGNVVTIPVIAGVIYSNEELGDLAGGDITITKDTFITARPAAGYKFPAAIDVDWLFEHTP